MAAPSSQELREALERALDAIQGEAAQINKVTRTLAELGYRTGPKVLSGSLDGSAVRIAIWPKTPLGDLILATGPSFTPRLFSPADIKERQPGVYVLLQPDTVREERARDYAGRIREVKPRPARPVKPAVRAKLAEPKVAAVVRSAAASVPARSTAADAERAELHAGLKQLLAMAGGK